MKINNEQLVGLINDKTPQARQTLSEISWLNFQELTNENLMAIDRALRQELLVLTAMARQISDDFYIWLTEMNKIVQEKERVNLIIRPRLRDNSLTIDWVQQRFYSNRTSGKYFVRSLRIDPSTKTRYFSTRFKRFPEWIRDRVNSTEIELCAIRESAESLTQLRRAVRNYKDLQLRIRNQKQKDLDLETLPIPNISRRKINDEPSEDEDV